ncbi:MAG: 4-alpha-glucanotransferase [Candidatus Omnitrophica bacterium]|nr:4-alpha-glucanotransferase [Candidatus Omnitrophota bacterium]
MAQLLSRAAFLSKKRVGVLVPLFSVYSKNSFGIGDFSDLKLLVDWICENSNSLLQLLPMNEMGGQDCPYDSSSSFALEPAYISFLDLPLPKDKSLKRQIENLRKGLQKGKAFLNYSIKVEKLRLLWEIFLLQDVIEPQGLRSFKEENAYWLRDFSLFKVIKQVHRGAAWYDWPQEFRERDRKALEDFCKKYSKEINFEAWLQWQLFEQFRGVRDYARAKNVFIKGDLPILVSRDSADVWAHVNFFKLEFAAGAPPDMYAALGQRWGMPTYNWEVIKQDGYKYLREKLRYAQNFYDVLRIDHVVGLFRIWSIPYNEPLENQGLNGFFDPADESVWGKHGKEILEVMLESTDMFLCAEDLGVIPNSCTQTLKDLNIPGNDVGRWVKDWKTAHDFLKPSDYRKLSVAMLSTHDTTNWPAWWENEAGTVDEALFMRKCSDHRNIGFERVKDKLFDLSRSLHGRMRWREEVDSVEKLVRVLSIDGPIPREHLTDLVDLYENTYHEKEKLWKQLALSGPMREKSDSLVLQAALRLNLEAGSLFAINTIFDLLYLGDILKNDAYEYRINTPGTISDKNWSLLIPLSIEELRNHKINKTIRDMAKSSGREGAD